MLLKRHDRCPVCDRSPGDGRAKRRCPECGFRLGENARTVARASIPVTALLVVGITLFVLAVRGEPIGRWDAAHLLVLSACVLLCWFVIRGRRPKAVLWREGCILLGRSERPERISWKEVADVGFDSYEKAVELRTAAGGTVAVIPVEFFGSHARAARFIDEARRCLGTDEEPAHDAAER